MKEQGFLKHVNLWGVVERRRNRNQSTDGCNVLLQVLFIHNLVVMAGETQSR